MNEPGGSRRPDREVLSRSSSAVLELVRRRHCSAERDGEAGTYIGDILRLRDSSLSRWPDRHGIPLTVWIQPRSGVKDYTPSYVTSVRGAFEEWSALQLPIRFTFVRDSADAEVHVKWIDHFNEPISGRTRWTRDDDWVITDANITLAVHHHQGETLDDDAMRAMAMHADWPSARPRSHEGQPEHHGPEGPRASAFERRPRHRPPHIRASGGTRR